MRSVFRVGLAGAIFGGALLLGAGHAGQRAGVAVAQVGKDMQRVVMFDSAVNFTPGNEYVGMWGFYPGHVAVTQGEQIEFDNPAGNHFPHTVTSITWGGNPVSRTLSSGTAFNSSPTMDDSIKVGGSYVLDTSTLDPGNYIFYCTIHPWMVGSLTVEPAAAQ
jgi:plastocyanin